MILVISSSQQSSCSVLNQLMFLNHFQRWNCTDHVTVIQMGYNGSSTPAVLNQVGTGKIGHWGWGRGAICSWVWSLHPNGMLGFKEAYLVWRLLMLESGTINKEIFNLLILWNDINPPHNIGNSSQKEPWLPVSCSFGPFPATSEVCFNIFKIC